MARETCPAMLMITSSPAPVLACRQAGGSPHAKPYGLDATRASPAATWRPSYHLAVPSRLWRPCVRTRANSGEPTADSVVWFSWRGNFCWRVARHSASQRKARKSMILW
jgi:hypothetical protein